MLKCNLSLRLEKTNQTLNSCGPYLLRAFKAAHGFIRWRWVQTAEHLNPFDSCSINIGQ